MQRNRNREDLRQDILYSLGHPIIRVNLTKEHLDNAINAAIKKIWRWHVDGSYENYYAYQVSAEDATNGWFLVDEDIDAVYEVLPGDGGYLGSKNFASAEWQMTSSTVLSMNRFLPLSLTDYVSAQLRITNTRLVLGDGVKPFKFVKHQHRVIPRFEFKEGDMIVMRVSENVDPEKWMDRGQTPPGYNSDLFWDNETLKDLALAYAKQQWGQILKRFSGMTMPGGVTIDGESLLAEGKEDESAVIQRLKDESVDFMIVG